MKPEKATVQLANSGVAKYLANLTDGESAKPALSGVAKYLENQAKQQQIKTLGLPNLSPGQAGLAAIEGEFIPANSFGQATGVSRYLDRQGSVAAVSTENLTGVSRYLANQGNPAKQQVTRPAVTGVDRYMMNRA